ncbi:hypothetical protein ACGIF2_04215 [Cellulomonas sp. P22]|uniref:hypothetical protein n=1 Tax=Cellulomonas sp. P22 TaxID=3373189 RepID=UPI00379F266D
MTSDPGTPDQPDVRPAPPSPTTAAPARVATATAWSPDGLGTTALPGSVAVDAPPVATGGEHAGYVPPPLTMPLAEPVSHRHPWPVIVLGLLLAVLLGASTYLVVLARSLEQRSTEWEQVARGTVEDLAQSRGELEGALAELEGTREQLGAAQARITELADEKAQLGDDREVQQRLVDYQERVSEAARDVASALSTCIDGQYRLIEYLQNAAQYDPTDLARFRSDVERVCGAATDANATLQKELDR